MAENVQRKRSYRIVSSQKDKQQIVIPDAIEGSCTKESDRLISVGESVTRIRKVRDEYEFDSEECIRKTYSIVKDVLSQTTIPGTANDFHNFAVDFARRDDYDTACKIIIRGLETYPANVDLLADFIQYGVFCNRYDECSKYYEQMMEIPKELWTWRGFSFGIDYRLGLINLFHRGLDIDIDDLKASLIELADQYRKYFPFSEDPFISKADIYKSFNEPELEIRILKEALATIANCPKSALRLADIYFDLCMYDDSSKCIYRCICVSTNTQEKINLNYLYFLSGLCKTVSIHKSSDYKNKDLIMDIYSDFKIAGDNTISGYNKIMNRYIRILEAKSGFLFSDYDDRNF